MISEYDSILSLSFEIRQDITESSEDKIRVQAKIARFYVNFLIIELAYSRIIRD